MLSAIQIDETFWSRFPEGRIVVMTLKGIDNRVIPEKEGYFKDLLQKGKEASLQFLKDDNFSQNPVVAEWREAYSQFKTKKGARSSIEAMLKRAAQDRDFNPINPLVDLYNYVSLTYATPVGAEDMDKVEGTLRLAETAGGDSFKPLGAEEDAPTLAGEVAWLDDAGAVCRCLNWREAQRTMLTEDTQNAIVIMETVNENQAARAQTAMNTLKDLCQDYFGVAGEILVLSSSLASATI
ncbi:B3/B4 domain-containing protein [Streptococcus merionis]|uniref:B3/B4 domain-containing protein n=1 Tax=Streptococcus merionis TaxID=400065 RepID=UPI003513D3E3